VLSDFAQDQYDLGNMWWSSGQIGHFYSHYAHLLPDSLLRQLRQMSMGLLTAHESINNVIGVYDWASNCQWLIRQTGYAQHAFLLVRTEQILRQRKTWSDALDLVTVSQKSNGQLLSLKLVCLKLQTIQSSPMPFCECC
jgi:hypothetical protein